MFNLLSNSIRCQTLMNHLVVRCYGQTLANDYHSYSSMCVCVCVCVFLIPLVLELLARLSWFLGIFLQASLRHRPCSRPSDVGSEPCRTASPGAGRRLLANGRALFCFSARLQSTLLKYTSPNCSICTNNYNKYGYGKVPHQRVIADSSASGYE